MSDSDIEIKKIPPMKPVKKPPASPTVEILKSHAERKASTRTMIHQALSDLKTRKGVSSYAIKKYLEEKYEVKTEKMKYLIKKTLKAGVEDGSIIQVKGIGASGSFKLANVKEKPKKKPKIKKDKEKAAKETTKDKPKKEKAEKSDKLKEKFKKVKTMATDEKKGKAKSEKPVKKAQKETEKKSVKEVKEKITGKRKVKAVTTPAKKRANMMKRKSIGSIIKKPKMKPKMKA